MGRYLLAMIVSTLASSAMGARYVDDANNTGVQEGTELRPFRTIQAAVDAAADNESVFVASGTYAGPVRVSGKAVQIIGGYAGGTGGTYESNLPGDFSTFAPDENPTTIEGIPTDAVVLFIEAGASRLEGFAIRGGGGAHEDAFRTQGGGIFVDGGSVTIDGNIIEDNDSRSETQEAFGGGIFTTNGNTIIRGNIIRSNRSGRGGGIGVSGGIVSITGNTIHGNVGNGDHGGGIYAFSPDITITNNDIFENAIGEDLGYGWGGGVIIFNPGAVALLSHNRIHNNYAPGRGSGIFIDEGAAAVVEHCLIYGNRSEPTEGMGAIYVDPSWDGIPSSLVLRHSVIYGHINPGSTWGNGVFVEGPCPVTVENSIIWGNSGTSITALEPETLTVRYTTAEEALTGPGNLTGDPLFAAPEAGDFHLRSRNGRFDPAAQRFVLDDVDSPCIDAADPASPYQNERPGNGGRANQGAYGNTPEASRTVNEDVAGILTR